jgi:hypothetical protein
VRSCLSGSSIWARPGKLPLHAMMQAFAAADFFVRSYPRKRCIPD